MKEKIKIRLLNCMGYIFEKSHNCKLEKDIFKKIDEELNTVSNYFNISKQQAFFVSNIFAMNYKSDAVDLKDLIEHLDCNPLKIVDYLDDLNILYNKGIVRREKREYNVNEKLTHDQLTIDAKIVEAIINNREFPELENNRFENILDLLEEIDEIANHTEQYIIPSEMIYERINNIISNNLNLPLLKKIREMNLNLPDTYLYLYLIWKTLNGHESFYITMIIDILFDKSSQRINYIQKLIANDNDLLKLKLLEIEPSKFFNDTEIRLTDYALELLEQEGIKLFSSKANNKNVIVPNKIFKKELFFNENEREEIAVIERLLHENNCARVQKRLKSKKMAHGISVMLHGPAGTGKTELVYQIARETQREIVHVDISQSKSMWFGESEKRIKQIFSDYYDYAKQCKLLPILLLNEADAIIFKRKSVLDSPVAQTENAIQNILLEELENFTGILFATTNLVQNIDNAFDRRFLYKIKLEIPQVNVKTKIWKSKLNMLSINHCKMLANKFNFSGAQIDNVARKCEMFEVVNGETASLNHIIEYCNAEFLAKDDRINIGFSLCK